MKKKKNPPPKKNPILPFNLYSELEFDGVALASLELMAILLFNYSVQITVKHEHPCIFSGNLIS